MKKFSGCSAESARERTDGTARPKILFLTIKIFLFTIVLTKTGEKETFLPFHTEQKYLKGEMGNDDKNTDEVDPGI